jgi:hypothetical protein
MFEGKKLIFVIYEKVRVINARTFFNNVEKVEILVACQMKGCHCIQT